MAIQLDTTLRNNMLDEITTRAGASAKLRIYAGTPPASAGAALSGNTLLADLTCNATFAPAASGGQLTLNAISSDTSADNTGTTSFFRIWDSGVSVSVLQGTVGTSGSDLNLNSVAISAGATVAVTSFVLTMGGA